MKRLRSKKGAALVSVLIGILFIAILASSLLFMATMNYQMKSMRQFSTDNFYTAEYALDDMLAQLKQYSSVQTVPIDSLKTFLKAAPGTGGGYTVFNEANLRSLIDISSRVPGLDPDFPVTGGGGVEVSCIYKNGGSYTRDTYKEDSNYIYLYGVQITVKTDEEHGDYKSTITTDLAFGFPGTTGNSGGLNDFSMLMDSPIYVNGGSPHFCGDVYCRSNGNGTVGASNAMRVGAGSIVSLLGSFSFFDGNIQIDPSGSLYVSGNVYVKGDVKVAAAGELVVGGDMYVEGSVTGTVREAGGTLHENDTTVDWDHYDDEFDDGLAKRLVSQYMHIHLNSSPTSIWYDGDRLPGDSSNLLMTQEKFAKFMGAGSTTANTATGTKNGRTVHAVYLTNGVTHNFEDTLIISPISPTSFHGTTRNCTWICTCSDGILQIDGSTDNDLLVWGNMDDESYNLAKDLLFVKPSQNNNFSGVTPNVPYWGGAGKFAQDIEPDLTSADSTMNTLGGDNIHWFTNGDAANQPYYYKDGEENINYFPYECFFHKDLQSILDDFRSPMSGGGGTSSAMPTIIISSWTKE